MIRDLASLLAPVPEQTFLDHFLHKIRLQVKAGQPDRAKALLPWAIINWLIDSDILPPDRLRVVRANVDIAPIMFRRQSGSQRLRAGALHALLPQGTSLLINSVDDLVPQIGRLADSLERRLAHRVGINSYLSFGRGSAFKAHWDDHDVLLVQVHGRKRWRSYGSPVPLPVEKYASGQTPTTEVV